MAAKRTVELVREETLSPSVKGLTFRDIGGAPFSFLAGQWFNFELETDQGVLTKRAYSIASAPGGPCPDELTIGVTRVKGGLASEALHRLAPGARLEVDGPYGFFTRAGEEDRPALFIGTGTGVCPLRAMLEVELRRDRGPALHLLFGGRSEDEMLFRSEFEAWAQRCPRFSYTVTLSRPSAAWAGRRGYVQHHLPQLVEGGERPILYVCGLTRMVSEVRDLAKSQLGYDRRGIRSERYD